MRRIFFTTLVILFLSACSNSITPSLTPTGTAVPTIAPTLTPLPTRTITPSPTVVPIPEFMNEFIELGYDKQPLSDSTSIYVVLDEKATFFASDFYGIKYKKSILYGWSKVHYIENNVVRTNFVIVDFCTEMGRFNDNKDVEYGCYVTSSFNLRTDFYPVDKVPAPQSVEWTKTIMGKIHEHSVGDYPIVRLEFNSEYFDAHNKLDFYFWDDIYPTFNGSFATFEIPNIGIFLPATFVEYDTSEGKWLANP